MEETKNPKCNSCKSYWKPDETDIKSSGLQYKTCRKCRGYYKENADKIKKKEKEYYKENADKVKERKKQNYKDNKCKHDKRKIYCRECGGGSICKHDKIKTQCRDCDGSSFCPHDKVKTNCRECGGGSICKHDKIKTQCRDCDGSSFCPHDKQKSRCRDCNGGSFCPHDKIKSICRECGGSSICPHDKNRRYCRDCRGSAFCPHDKRKTNCKDCNLQLYLVNLQRRAIHRCLKLSNLEKTKHSIEYLGCSPEYFKEYFKKKMDNFNQFSEIEMTWDNIHIDHIKPVSSFNLDDEEEFLSCCNYTNLQPLLAEVNLNKNCKWSDEDDVFWNEKIKDKEYYDIYIPK